MKHKFSLKNLLRPNVKNDFMLDINNIKSAKVNTKLNWKLSTNQSSGKLHLNKRKIIDIEASPLIINIKQYHEKEDLKELAKRFEGFKRKS